MAQMQMLPPPNGATTKINKDRSYTGVAGNSYTIPDYDAPILEANGWTLCATGGSGAASGRPLNPIKGTIFHDLTLGYNILWDGKAWRNPTSGAAI